MEAHFSIQQGKKPEKKKHPHAHSTEVTSLGYMSTKCFINKCSTGNSKNCEHKEVGVAEQLALVADWLRPVRVSRKVFSGTANSDRKFWKKQHRDFLLFYVSNGVCSIRRPATPAFRHEFQHVCVCEHWEWGRSEGRSEVASVSRSLRFSLALSFSYVYSMQYD